MLNASALCLGLMLNASALLPGFDAQRISSLYGRYSTHLLSTTDELLQLQLEYSLEDYGFLSCHKLNFLLVQVDAKRLSSLYGR
jgi:hypothetical protein